MKNIYVNNLSKGTVLNKETFAISDIQKAQDKTGKEYANITLADKTGKIQGKIWADTLSLVNSAILTPGIIVVVNAKVEEFRGNLQLNITEITQANELKLEEYMETSEFNAEEMFSELMDYVNNIKNKDLQQVLIEMFKDINFVSNYKFRPAAKTVHHDFRSGLIHHVLEMLQIAKSMQKYYPTANYDILYAGIILHDIGKFEEMEVNGLGVEYTKRGMLVGHISLGAIKFSEHAKGKLSEDLYLHILHLILSHHGELQYGSPVAPATLEAAMLSYIDRLSDKARTALKAIKEITPGKEFGNYNIFMENARFWKGGNYLNNNQNLKENSNDKGDQLIFSTENE